MSEYGKPAALVLAGMGVTPSAAGRILREAKVDAYEGAPDELIRPIVREERRSLLRRRMRESAE